MNTFFYLGALAVALMLTSCSSSKKTAASEQPQWLQQQTQRVEEKLDDCEIASLDFSDGKLKAYASAIDVDRDFARQQAAALARGVLASDIQACVTNVMRIYRGTTSSNDVSTSSRNAKQTIDQIAEECIANSTIVCSKRYVLSNNRYECSVCVSMVGTLEDAAKKAILSNDAALKVEFDEHRFRESYKEDVEQYRKEKANK